VDRVPFVEMRKTGRGEAWGVDDNEE